MVIAEDQKTTSTSTSFSFTHGAKVLVIVVVADCYDNTCTGVTCGGAAMTKLTHCQVSAKVGVQLWYIFRPSAATETIACAGTIYFPDICVVSYTGTAIAEPFFEGTATNTCSSVNSCAVNIAAGTTGRRVFGANGLFCSVSQTVSPAANFSEIEELPRSGYGGYYQSCEIEYYDTDGATSAGGDSGNYPYWACIVTAILKFVPVIKTGFRIEGRDFKETKFA
jgi:hypothetical protein